MKNTDPEVRFAGSKQLGPSVHHTRRKLNGDYCLYQTGRLYERVTRATSTLRVTKGSNLIDVELVKESTCGIAVGVDHEIRGIEYGLTCAGLLVLRGNHHKTPRRHVPQEIIVLER